VVVSSAIRDISERKKSELALRASEERFRTIIEKAFKAVIAMDDAGRIMTWNPSAAAMFGWTAPEVIGRNLTALIIPPRLRADHDFQRYLADGTGPVLDSYRAGCSAA
jgi:two-component system sensor histidine kinase UhpB